MSAEAIVFLAELGDWGCFTGEQLPKLPPSPGDGVAENVRQDFAIIHVDGLKTALQFSRVNITPYARDEPIRCVVVSAYPPFPPELIPDARRQLLSIGSSASLCLITEDKTGWARASSVTNHPSDVVAAAVAHSKIVGGWDETNPIVVAVDGAVFHVSSQFQDARWKLSVVRAYP